MPISGINLSNLEKWQSTIKCLDLPHIIPFMGETNGWIYRFLVFNVLTLW